MTVTISGAPQGNFTIYEVAAEGEASAVAPLYDITVTDDDPNTLLSVGWITSSTDAELTGNDLTATDGPGIWTLPAESAAKLTADLRSIVFSPPAIGSVLSNPGNPPQLQMPSYSASNPVSTVRLNISDNDGDSAPTVVWNVTEIFPSKSTAPTTAHPTTPPKRTTPVTPAPADNFNIDDTTTGAHSQSAGQAYSGPVSGLTTEYISPTQDSLNITAQTPNEFIVTGAGNDAVNVASGNNVVSAGTGNNFLTGGSGDDTFFVDARSSTAVWDTVNGFHVGDGVTIWGTTPQQIFQWQDNQGATGYTGVTFHTPEASGQYASLTLAGFTQADLTSGKLSETFGTDASGNPYLYIQGH